MSDKGDGLSVREPCWVIVGEELRRSAAFLGCSSWVLWGEYQQASHFCHFFLRKSGVIIFGVYLKQGMGNAALWFPFWLDHFH